MSRRSHAAAVALATSFTASIATSVASADIVHRVVDLPIPVTQAGLWINLETQAVSTTSTPPAGWDVNFYTSGGYTEGPAAGMANIVLYTGSSNGSGFMRYPGTLFGTPAELPGGTTVAAYGVYGAGWAHFGPQEGAWKLDADNFIGLKFRAADGQLRYGWARIAVGPNSGQRVLAEYAYESTPNTCIAVGAIKGAPPADCAAPPPYEPCAPSNLEAFSGENLLVANQTTTTPLVVDSGGCAFTIEHANWWRFTPPASGAYSVNTCANSTDTRMAVLSACGPKAQVLGCNDDFCAAASATTFEATAGETVWIVVGGAAASTILPTFMPLTIEAPFDACAAAPEIATGTTIVPTNDATPPLDLAGHCDSGPIHPNTIYKANYASWTAPKTAYYRFGICGNEVDAHVAVLRVCGDASSAIACSYDQCLAPSGATVGFWGDAGTTYVLAYGVDEPSEPLPAAVALDIVESEPPPDPCGDDLLVGIVGMQSIRLDLDWPNLPLTGSSCSFPFGDQALRYPKYLRFTAPTTGLYTMGNCSDTDPNFWGIYDLRIAVMTGCGDASTIFACDDNGCTGGTAPWTAVIRDLPLSAGETVYIGLGGNGPAAPGPFAFEISVEGTGGDPCPADLNLDGQVDAADLAAVLGAWGTPAGDLNDDGLTDAADLAAVLGAWGPC